VRTRRAARACGSTPALTELAINEVRDRPGVLPVLSTGAGTHLGAPRGRRAHGLVPIERRRSGGALERVGEEAWAALDDAERVACKRILARLAVDEDGTWVRRWVRRTDLADPEDPVAESALAVLTSRRLVVARTGDVAVVHEALLTGWPRLRGWLEDGRAHASVRERLANAVAAWQESDRDPAELFRGTRSRPRSTCAAADPETLTPAEQDFLDASVAEADRRLADERSRAEREARGRRRARLIAVALALALVFTTSAGGYAITQQRRAADAAATALPVGAVRGCRPSRGACPPRRDYDRALLLAAQAVALQRSPATRERPVRDPPERERGQARDPRPRPLSSRQVPAGRRCQLWQRPSPGQVVRWPVAGGPRPRRSTSARSRTSRVRRRRRPARGRSGRAPPRSVRQVPASGRPVTGAVVAEGPEIGADVWSPTGDGKAVVAAAPSLPRVKTGTTRAKPTSSCGGSTLWRARHSSSASAPAHCGSPPAAPAAPAFSRAHRHLVRIRVSDGAVEGDVQLPPGSGQPILRPWLRPRRPAGRAPPPRMAVVRLVDVRTGRVIRELSGQEAPCACLAFSHDGRRIAGADVGAVLVWQTDRASPRNASRPRRPGCDRRPGHPTGARSRPRARTAA
jgi:hypothetical protein